MRVLLFLAKTTQKCYLIIFTPAETFFEIKKKYINRLFAFSLIERQLPALHSGLK